MDRLELQHAAFRILFHGNFNAPIDDALDEGIKVLDAGCGPGHWTVEMAGTFPNSTFYGTDISEVFIDPAPQNCNFTVANTLEGLPFEDDYFDFVYQRKMSTSFSSNDYHTSVNELKRVTKPGGYIELVEYDSVFKQRGPTWALVQDTFNATILARGALDMDVSNMSAFLADMEDINSDYASFPIGWRGPIGEHARQNTEVFLEVIRPLLQLKLGYTDGQYDSMVLRVTMEWSQYRTWANGYYAYAQKRGGSAWGDGVV